MMHPRVPPRRARVPVRRLRHFEAASPPALTASFVSTDAMASGETVLLNGAKHLMTSGRMSEDAPAQREYLEDIVMRPMARWRVRGKPGLR